MVENSYLDPSKYVDCTVIRGCDGWIDCIYAVTEPRGDVMVWETFKWRNYCLIRSEVFFTCVCISSSVFTN